MNETRILEKLDKLEEKLSEYNTTLSVNTSSLQEHIRRTTIAEQRIEKLQEEVHGLWNFKYYLMGGCAVLGLVGALLLKLIK